MKALRLLCAALAGHVWSAEASSLLTAKPSTAALADKAILQKFLRVVVKPYIARDNLPLILLDPRSFLQAMDPEHRDSVLLADYLVQYRALPAQTRRHSSFFQWLDDYSPTARKPGKLRLYLGAEQTTAVERAWWTALEDSRVAIMGPAERDWWEVVLREADGALVYKMAGHSREHRMWQGERVEVLRDNLPSTPGTRPWERHDRPLGEFQPVDTTARSSTDNEWLLVVDHELRVFVFPHLHHLTYISATNGGGPVLCAGRITVVAGKFKQLRSTHDFYRIWAQNAALCRSLLQGAYKTHQNFAKAPPVQSWLQKTPPVAAQRELVDATADFGGIRRLNAMQSKQQWLQRWRQMREKKGATDSAISDLQKLWDSSKDPSSKRQEYKRLAGILKTLWDVDNPSPDLDAYLDMSTVYTDTPASLVLPKPARGPKGPTFGDHVEHAMEKFNDKFSDLTMISAILGHVWSMLSGVKSVLVLSVEALLLLVGSFFARKEALSALKALPGVFFGKKPPALGAPETSLTPEPALDPRFDDALVQQHVEEFLGVHADPFGAKQTLLSRQQAAHLAHLVVHGKHHPGRGKATPSSLAIPVPEVGFFNRPSMDDD